MRATPCDRTLRLRAPAKVNLILHVVGRRGDGYHELQTLFAILDRCDVVRLSVRADGRVSRAAGAAGVAPDDDLAVRAARLLQREAGVEAGASIRIEKRIPLGGGLGGGSSDAAAVLVGLNALWGLGWSRDRLRELGLGLGADVPVFVAGRPAWAQGVGERLEPVRLPPAWYVVLTPPVEVSTAAVFAAPALTRNTPHSTISRFLRDPSGRPCPSVAAIVRRGRNDCEPVARALYPEVGEALDWLGERGTARMSGTGASVFLAVADEARARRLAGSVPGAWPVFVARGLDRSPLLDVAAEETG